MKKVLGVILAIVVILIVLVGVYFLFMTLTDYKPEDVIALEIENNQNRTLQNDDTVSIMTFNIGYCGLDKTQDFFMDGGTKSHSESKEKTLENLNGMINFMKDNPADMFLLQEVDIKAKRSFNINQYDLISADFKQYSSVFAINYKVPWVPLPVFDPMGGVEAGLLTLSDFAIKEANRYQYPGDAGWPMQLGLLDRCFIETRISVDNGKELVVLNSHLSAYDKGGTIRKQQLGFLKEYITSEYGKGNYVVVAGDWNHLIPGTDPKLFETEQTWPDWLVTIPDDFKPEGFEWAADKTIPTNRTLDQAYQKGVNFLSVIDGFLVSPNVEVVSVEGYSLEFEHSDHNPVRLEIKLK
ncbi:MAG TPA: endonuclease/exonuclease/phosphatase family protein [Thermotogota bacterium]|nr:endonuclease/exonuclease/phosphatase family protein [Thermotogota bacterium]